MKIQKLERRTLVSLCTYGLSVITFFSASIASSQPGALKRVLKGQEIVVSFPKHGGGFSTRASRKADNLKRPRGVVLRTSLDKGTLGVFSTAGAIFSKEEIMQVDEEAVRDACSKLKQENPTFDLTCEPNYIVETTRSADDPYLGSLWGMSIINAPGAWDVNTGSPAVTVAVVDTGVEYTHPDLAANIAINSAEVPSNGLDDDQNGFVDDVYGYDFINNDASPMDDNFHGTHCAGTIGAVGNNGVGVVGVAWNVKLMPVKVLSGTGSGSIATVAAGINYAVSRGVKIVSMSLGTSSYSQTLEDAVRNAKQHGTLIVAAAGNSGQNSDLYPLYPAASTQDNVISVAASNQTDGLASFSNFGANSVDIAAPGVSILSTALSQGYAYASGTSMATPHVAGMAAILASVNSSLSYADIKSALVRGVETSSAFSGKMTSGGRANLYRSLTLVYPTPLPTQTPTPAPTTPSDETPSPEPTSAPEPSPTPVPTDPEEPDEPGYDEPNYLTIGVERSKRRVFIFGEIRDSEDNLLADENVTLVCRRTEIAAQTSDAEGYYEFSLRRPRKVMTCWVEDDEGTRSRRIRVR
jgi:subtilisin family serine protease